MQSQQSLILIKNQGFFPVNLSYTNGLGDLCLLVSMYTRALTMEGDRNPPRATESKGELGTSLVHWLRFSASPAEGMIPGSGRSPGEGNNHQFQHSCWRIPWTEESEGLQSMGSQIIGHNWATKHTQSKVNNPPSASSLLLSLSFILLVSTTWKIVR